MRRLRLRELTDEERVAVERLAHSRTAPARQVERARIIWHANQGQDVPRIAEQTRLHVHTVRDWIKRFNSLPSGLTGGHKAWPGWRINPAPVGRRPTRPSRWRG